MRTVLLASLLVLSFAQADDEKIRGLKISQWESIRDGKILQSTQKNTATVVEKEYIFFVPDITAQDYITEATDYESYPDKFEQVADAKLISKNAAGDKFDFQFDLKVTVLFFTTTFPIKARHTIKAGKNEVDWTIRQDLLNQKENLKKFVTVQSLIEVEDGLAVIDKVSLETEPLSLTAPTIKSKIVDKYPDTIKEIRKIFE